MDSEEHQHLEELLQANLRRLRPLEKQKAQFGAHTDPAVITEIEDLQQEIFRLKNKLGISN